LNASNAGNSADFIIGNCVIRAQKRHGRTRVCAHEEHPVF